MKETTIKYIATKVKQLKDEPGYSTILFLGAGVSKTAGIPLAGEIVDDIDKHPVYKDLIEEGTPKSYTRYMDCLSNGDRKKLFNSYIDKAKINASHLYAAQLVAKGYVDYVVTTNFDPLMLKSLGLFNIVPSVYDLAIIKDKVTTGFQPPAIIYFHGQSHGFWQLNTDYELELPVNAIKDTINKISVNRAWIVVGYSGSDPVFNQLSSIDNFTEGIYWVGYEKKLPNDNVIKQLLDIPTNGSLYLKEYNSDSFFRALKNELKLDEPQIISKPFTYLLKAIENITTLKIDDKELDLCSETREQIKKVIIGFENKKGFEDLDVSKEIIKKEDLLKKVKEIFNSEKYEDLKLIESNIIESKEPETLKYYSYVLYNWGNSLSDLAKIKEGKEAEELFKESFEKYRKATEIKKDKHEAFNNWGTSLLHLAKMKEGKEAKEVFEESIKRLEIAENILEGSGAYDLACVYSLLQDKEKALVWFDKSLRLSEISRKNIEQDTDLDNIRKDEKFNKLLDKYRK